MAQAGNLVVLGDAGEALGDSLYEARLFVRGTVKSLGADCIEKAMRDEHATMLAELLKRAGVDGDGRPDEFRRYGSARKLYNFHIDNADGLLMAALTIAEPRPHPAAQVRDLRRLHDLRDPPRGGDRHLRHPRRRREAQAAAFRRPAVPRRLDLAAIRSKAIARNAAPTSCSAPASPKKPIAAEDPDHHRRHELRLAVRRRPRRRSAAARRRRHLDHHRRRRHDRGGARPFADAGLPGICRRATA